MKYVILVQGAQPEGGCTLTRESSALAVCIKNAKIAFKNSDRTVFSSFYQKTGTLSLATGFPPARE